MARYISDDYQCEECGHVWTELNDRDLRPDRLDCQDECCKAELSAIKLFGAPMPLRASYHDGKDRGDTYKKLKEANKLTKQMYEKPANQRSELRAEIKKLKSNKPQ